MKRIIAVLLASLFLLALTACKSEPEPTAAPTQPEPQPHTVSPASTVEEPEWAPVDSDVALLSDGEPFAASDAFTYFAIVGRGEDAVIRLKVNSLTASMLKSAEGEPVYSVTLNGKKIGDAKVSEDFEELTLINDYSYEELCELATDIRGVKTF